MVTGLVGFVAGCVGFVVFSVVGRGGWVGGDGPGQKRNRENSQQK